MPQELSIANDGANESVTYKKRLRVSNVNITRGASVVFSTERATIDNTTDLDAVVNSGPQVVRGVSAIMSETVTQGGQPVSFQTAMAILGKFYAKWRAEDVAAENP